MSAIKETIQTKVTKNKSQNIILTKWAVIMERPLLYCPKERV